jgi:hypothetical protein
MDLDTKNKINSFCKSHTKAELQKMCKEKNKVVSGTKYDLASRLFSQNDEKNISIDKSNNIILRICKNKFGNYCHEESKLVFDINTKRVIGLQLENGNVRPINRSDIEICQKYKFQYSMPQSLDPSPIYEVLENSDKEDEESESHDIEEEDDQDEDMMEDEINEDDD